MHVQETKLSMTILIWYSSTLFRVTVAETMLKQMTCLQMVKKKYKVVTGGQYSPWSYIWSRDDLNTCLRYSEFWLLWRDREWFGNVGGFERVRNGYELSERELFEGFAAHRFRLRLHHHNLNLFMKSILSRSLPFRNAI